MVLGDFNDTFGKFNILFAHCSVSYWCSQFLKWDSPCDHEDELCPVSSNYQNRWKFILVCQADNFMDT